MLEWCFLISWIFFYFFGNFLARVGLEQYTGLKFFPLFLGLSHPSLDRNKAGMMIFNFLNFFAIFLEFSSLCWVGTEFGTNIFLSFSAYLIPVWIEIISKWCFFNLLNFFAFFLEFSSPGRVGTEFGTKFSFCLFLGLSHSGLDRNNNGMMFFNFFNFLLFFLEFSYLFQLGTKFGTKFFFFSLSQTISSRSG